MGITGNIGSGKSTVSNFLKAMGYSVYNADKMAKELLLPDSPCFEEVLRAFGNEILTSGGLIDTEKLGKIVFSDPEKLNILTSITHPELLKRIESLRGKGLVFVEAAVLVEYGWQERFDRIVLVYAYKGQRLLRAARRFGFKEAVRRDSLQLPYAEKIKYSDYLLCNTGDLLHLKKQVESMVSELEVL
ncbi:MAG: dephospho-CoA kinase [Desulfurobacteriaceae bacterium]